MGRSKKLSPGPPTAPVHDGRDKEVALEIGT